MMFSKSISRVVNRMRLKKNIYPMEWLMLYRDSFDKVCNDICHNMYSQHIFYVDKEEAEQVCLYVFFKLYNNFINNGDVLFPPDEEYFYTICMYHCVALVYGTHRTSASFTPQPYLHYSIISDDISSDTYITDIGGVERSVIPFDREYDEATMDELDWYLLGLNKTEIALWIYVSDASDDSRSATVFRRVNRFIEAIAQRDNVPYEVLKKEYHRIHKENRKKVIKVLPKHGFRLRKRGKQSYEPK